MFGKTPVIVQPSQLSDPHYFAIAAGLLDAVKAGIDPDLQPILSTNNRGNDRYPVRESLVSWGTTPAGRRLRLRVNCDHQNVNAALYIGDGDIGQSEGVIAAWTVHWYSPTAQFIVQGSRRQFPRGPLDGDWQPLRFDAPLTNLVGRPIEIEGTSTDDSLPGLTGHLVAEINHWLVTPAPAIPANIDL